MGGLLNVILSDSTGTQIINDSRPESSIKLLSWHHARTAKRSGNSLIDSFSFDVAPGNPAYNAAVPYMAHIEAIDGTETVFRGRVATVSKAMDSTGMLTNSVVCEDYMAYLNDTVQPYVPVQQYDGDDDRTGLEEFIDVVLGNHNASVEADKRIYRGTVTVSPHLYSDGVYKGLNYEKTLDALKTKLLDSFGGEFRIRYTGGLLYLDYADHFGTQRGTHIAAGRNMQSMQQDIDSSDVITRLIPLGAKLTEQVIDEQGNVTEQQTEERLNIAGINDGVPYVINETAEELYGIHYATEIWDDVTDSNNLLQKGTDWLAAHNQLMISTGASVLDLSQLDLDPDTFKVGDYFTVENPLLGVSMDLEVLQVTTDSAAPYAPSLTLGDVGALMTNEIIRAGNRQDQLEQQIGNVQTETSNRVASVYTYVTDTASRLQQYSDQIVAEVSQETVARSDYDAFRTQVRNLLQMDASGVSLIFDTIREEISGIDNGLSSTRAEILRFLRWDGAAGRLMIGDSTSPIELAMENDKLYMSQNGVPVMTLTDSEIDITIANIRRSLRIGQFVADPRDNGDLSWRVIR